jgi:hypothetical protein
LEWRYEAKRSLRGCGLGAKNATIRADDARRGDRIIPPLDNARIASKYALRRLRTGRDSRWSKNMELIGV